MKAILLGLLGLAGSLLTSCAEPCNGHIESTVLYFAEGPNHQGQLVYANVLNKPDLGRQHTLMRDDKEYGTFGNVIIIEDPQNQFKGRRSVCFDEFKVQPMPADGRLDETDITRIVVLK
ncbi:hypothetical protein FNT36_17195 [Hymenobacter setariae]|uniref:Lipoprotein n=1 Tax=Hymenobacter setariae TaxID=2594794 RepID=A0A558BS94_9BACT|nr:hypothetical protein [Hymenobacter setariae]TVT39390.1 hypothetical protein FNT36_17195 [Hymenobacter setariae]